MICHFLPFFLTAVTGGISRRARAPSEIAVVGHAREGADRAWRVPEGASVGVLNAKLGALVEHCRARGRHLVIVFVPGGVCAR